MNKFEASYKKISEVLQSITEKENFIHQIWRAKF